MMCASHLRRQPSELLVREFSGVVQFLQCIQRLARALQRHVAARRHRLVRPPELRRPTAVLSRGDSLNDGRGIDLRGQGGNDHAATVGPGGFSPHRPERGTGRQRLQSCALSRRLGGPAVKALIRKFQTRNGGTKRTSVGRHQSRSGYSEACWYASPISVGVSAAWNLHFQSTTEYCPAVPGFT